MQIGPWPKQRQGIGGDSDANDHRRRGALGGDEQEGEEGYL